ncbi:MAG: peptidoglycan editing factor PgeF [Alphaproteobacteria bacterium]|nr:peptidoglycan editing factor PgeF [Alphaproteobacteria bacterium]
MIFVRSKVLENVQHNFFGRSSGFSKGHYASLNCSKFVKDDPLDVAKNLKYIQELMHFKKIVLLDQVHGRDCLVVEADTRSDQRYDAMVTKEVGVALGIVTADCVPALFFDEENHVIGAAHAGWKGAVSGVLESTVKNMFCLGASAEKIKVALGPCIQKDSYQVQQDFVDGVSDGRDCFIYRADEIFFDMPKYCKQKLVKAGLSSENIEILSVDTYQNHETFFSFRYARLNSNGVCGRNLSCICL